MARLETLLPKDAKRTSVHGEVEATFHIFDHGGETFLQIDTYGAPGRQIPEKVSQSIQLGRSGISQLKAILAALS